MITTEELIKLNSFKNGNSQRKLLESDYISFKCRLRYFLTQVKELSFMNIYDLKTAFAMVYDEICDNVYKYFNK